MTPRNLIWVQSLPDNAKSALLKDVCFAGTHDSAAYVNMNSKVTLDGEPFFSDLVRKFTPVTVNLLYNQVNKWTKTQDTSIYEQFANGIRYLDLRIAYSSKKKQYYTLHSFAMVPLHVVLNDIKRFATLYPNELLIIDLSLYYTLQDDIKGQLAIDYILSWLSNHIYVRNENDSKNPFNTKSINDIISTGKNILMLQNEYAQKSYQFQESQIYDKWIDTNNAEVKIEGLEEQLQLFVPSSGQSYLMEWTLTPQISQILGDVTGSLKKMSVNFHSLLPRFLVENEANVYKIGIIAVDYESSIDLSDIVMDINNAKFA